VQHNRHRDNAAPQADISRLIDLSRYELPTNRSDDFRARMAANGAALVLLVTLVAVAAIDVIDIEKIERCAPGSQCRFTANLSGISILGCSADLASQDPIHLARRRKMRARGAERPSHSRAGVQIGASFDSRPVSKVYPPLEQLSQ
jgi:hypothetical protein